MVTAIFALLLLAILIVLAVLIISSKPPFRGEGNGEPVEPPLIQASGIYSIIRRSPREDLLKIRPGMEEIRKYLSSINEDINMKPLSIPDKEKIAESWLRSMEENIRVIEKSDTANSAFYFYLDNSGGNQCAVCATHFKSKQIITREEIFKNPSIIPPFHLGCTTRIMPYRNKESGTGSLLSSILPLFSAKKFLSRCLNGLTTVRIKDN